MKTFFSIAATLFISTLIMAADLPEKWEIKFFRCDEKTFLKGLSADDAKQQIQGELFYQENPESLTMEFFSKDPATGTEHKGSGVLKKQAKK